LHDICYSTDHNFVGTRMGTGYGCFDSLVSRRLG